MDSSVFGHVNKFTKGKTLNIKSTEREGYDTYQAHASDSEELREGEEPQEVQPHRSRPQGDPRVPKESRSPDQEVPLPGRREEHHDAPSLPRSWHSHRQPRTRRTARGRREVRHRLIRRGQRDFGRGEAWHALHVAHQPREVEARGFMLNYDVFWGEK